LDLGKLFNTQVRSKASNQVPMMFVPATMDCTKRFCSLIVTVRADAWEGPYENPLPICIIWKGNLFFPFSVKKNVWNSFSVCCHQRKCVFFHQNRSIFVIFLCVAIRENVFFSTKIEVFSSFFFVLPSEKMSFFPPN
jgi:hypothetical protein